MRLKNLLLAMFVCCGLGACAESKLEFASGEHKRLSDYHGQWLLINYWAIWCQPCIKEIPELNELDKRASVNVLAYNFDHPAQLELEAQAKRLKIEFPSIVTEPSALFGEQVPRVLPATMLINPQGELQRWLLGPQTVQTIDGYIKSS